MRIILPIKAISVNAAWCGRRFSTPAKKQFEQTVALMLPARRLTGPYYRVYWDFYLLNWARTDASNLVKTIEDCLVRSSIISDDRNIIEHRIRKIASKVDRIEIEIQETSTP